MRKGGKRKKTKGVERRKWEKESGRVGKTVRNHMKTGRGEEEKQKGVLWQVKDDTWREVLEDRRRKKAILRKAYLAHEVKRWTGKVNENTGNKLDSVWREN